MKHMFGFCLPLEIGEGIPELRVFTLTPFFGILKGLSRKDGTNNMESSPAFTVEKQLPNFDLLLQRAFFTKIQMVEVNREFRYLHITFFIRAIFWSAVLLGIWDIGQIFLDGLLERTVSWVIALLLISFVVWSILGHLYLIRAKKHARRVAEVKTDQQYPFGFEQPEQMASVPQKATPDRIEPYNWLWASNID